MDPSPAKGVSRVDIGLYAVAGVAAAVGWLVHRIAFGEPILPVDDAYITLHNALSFWQPDLAYPETPPLVGSTSGWHTLLIALAALALAPTSASYAMAGAAMVVYALGVVHLARALDLDRWLVLPMVAAGLLVGDLPHHLFNGLETGLALAALTWTLALWCSPASTRRDAALAVLCGQLPWIRPELAAVAAMAIGTQLLTREDRRVAGPRMVGLAIASGLPWLIAYFVATGGPISSTARVKARWFTEFCAPVDVRLARTGTHLLEFTGRVGVLSLGLLFAWRSAAGRAGLLFMSILVAGFLVLMPGGLKHYTYRYLYIFVPFLMLGLMNGVSLAPRRWVAPAVGIGLMVQLAITVPDSIAHHERTRRFTTNQLAPAALMLQHLPDHARVLVHDAGYLGFAGGRQLIDVVGLKTRSSAESHARLTAPSCGADRGEAIAEIAARHEVTHAVILQQWDERYKIRKGLSDRGWKVVLLSPPDRKYGVFSLTPPSRPQADAPASAPRGP